MKKPFFSVVICTYNRAALLPLALESVFMQSFKDFELIIVDDGSTDSTAQVVRKFKALKYFKKAHGGVAKAKNFALSKAKGKFITYLDSDDEYLPDHLPIRKNILQKYPDTEFLYGGFKTIGKKYVPDFFKPGKLIHVNKVVLGGTFVVKAGLFAKVGKYKNIKYGEDTEFFHRAKNLGAKIKKINAKTYLYYRHISSHTRGWENKIKTARQRAAKV